jgi:hypothetical protein
MPGTQIVQRQIADGAINDAKVASGANIASSKLADGGNFIKKDGSVAFTGNQSMGGNAITNLATPSGNNDAANKAYVDTQISGLNSIFDSKPSARAASTGNVTVSNPGTASFDGVTLSNGDILFLRAQSAPAENGLYTFNGSGAALTRISQMDAWAEIPGALFTVDEGSTYADTVWFCTSNQGGTLGTTAITFQQVNASGLTASNFVDKEIPSGSINGSNTTFTLANTPVSGSEHLYLNGILQLFETPLKLLIDHTMCCMLILHDIYHI